MAQNLEGNTGADIQAICEEATLLTIRKAVIDSKINTKDAASVKKVKISKTEFNEALAKVSKSAEKARVSHEKYSKEPSEGMYR